MYNDFIQKLRTKEEVFKLQDEVDLLLKAVYQNRDMYNDILHNSIRNWVTDLIIDGISKNNGNIENFLEGLIKELEKIKTINLTIAFEPTPSTVENIGNWVKQNLGQEIVVNFVTDPKIIGGAIISYEGKYVDLSLQTKFNETLDELIRNVPPKTSTSLQQ